MNLHFLLVLFTQLVPLSMATSFYIRPFSEFTSSTQNIVRGTLSEVHAANITTADGQKAIYTYANLDVKEVFKGDITKHIILVRKIGGTVDGFTVEIPSSPELKDGEDTVLFLGAQKEDSAYEITGLELGKFGLEEKNGETYLKGGLFNYAKAENTEEAEHNKYADNLDENRKSWSLSALRDLIRKQKASATPAPAENKAAIAAPSTTVIPHETPKSATANDMNSTPKTEENHILLYSALAIFLAFISFILFRKKQ